MKKVLRSPQIFFILLAILITIIGFFKRGTQLDFNYFLSFLLIDVWSIAIVSALFFILISINFSSLKLMSKTPKKSLTSIQVVLQIIALLPLIYYMTVATEGQESQSVALSNIILLFSFVIFILSVIIHLLNFFISLFKENK